MPTKTTEISAKEKILKKAEELFYNQGYQATGINQIIEESGVAKATFYANYPSKDELCLEYLRTVTEKEVRAFQDEIKSKKTPLQKFMCTVELLEPMMKDSDYKGCSYLNMVPEIPDPKHPIRKEASRFYEIYEEMIREVTEELIASDRKKYGHLKVGEVAKQYMTLVAGGLSLAALHHSSEPMKNAVRMVRTLVK